MTLTAFTVRPDEVEIVTDTLAWTAGFTALAYHPKVWLDLRRDAAVHTRGSGMFGWRWRLEQDTTFVEDSFDSWHDEARKRLPGLWIEHQELDKAAGVVDDGSATQMCVWHFGWSESRGRFVVFEYDSEDEFAGRDWSEHDGVWSFAASREPQPAPADDQGWIDYVNMVRDEKADPMVVATEGQWAIGGDLIHTRLTRGQAITRRIHTFPYDWAHRRQFIGSMSYMGQLGPCPCGSGQPFLCCHLSDDQTCMCGTGKPFADCHMLDPSDPKAHSYWAAHLDDFARDRDAYAAAWRATMPDDPLSEHEPQDVIGLVRGALA